MPHARLACDPSIEDGWLAAFHAGDRALIGRCYEEHQRTVMAAVGRILSATDSETVAHDVFYRVLSDAELRRNFQGGNLAAWMTRVARNAAIDYLRRHRREQVAWNDDTTGPALEALGEAGRLEEELDARVIVERFRRECLPPAWAGVFDARFLRQASQRQAAEELGIQRTTLVYRELRIRRLLTQFLLRTKRQ
ncbi:MAG: RNA polymerase sigma factor [Polyangiaceae bacterium]